MKIHSLLQVAKIITIIILIGSGKILATPIDSTASPAWQNWWLPMQLSKKNLEIGFKVDSTWHMVHGKVQDVSGTIQLKDPLDPMTIETSIIIAVAELDTENSMRDEKLSKVMHADKYPEIRFQSIKFENLCLPKDVLASGTCQASVLGLLTIRDVAKEIKAPIIINKNNSDFIVTGQFNIDWSEFGVEDPSILIATVDKTVNINFKVTLTK